MKKFSTKFHRGENGFMVMQLLLIELVAVASFLGMLTVVVVPSLGKFVDADGGIVEAANAEANSVCTAVFMYIEDNNLTSVTEGAVGPNHDLTSGSANTTPKSFLASPASLQATYAINSKGEITSADASPGGKWDGLTYAAGTGWHE